MQGLPLLAAKDLQIVQFLFCQGVSGCSYCWRFLISQTGMFFVWFFGAGCGCESVSRSTCANGSYRGVQG
jgi:hypothetical protein